MRSTQLPRPQAKFNKTKSKLKKNPLSSITAEDRVNAFLSNLQTTPIVTKPTKTIHYANKKPNLLVTNKPKHANNTNNTRRNNKENMKPQTQMVTKHRNRNNRRNNNMIQQRKTSIARPMTNYLNNNNERKIERKHERKKSLSNNTNSKATSPLNEQNKIDQYSLSLQIKNSECEILKNENNKLKNEIENLKERNNNLTNIENEHGFCKEKILNLHQGLINKNDRILKLENKLENCGIDPIALKSPEFMNADTEKSIIFWRERLCKASQKVKQKKIKQKQHLQTAKYYIQQLQNDLQT